MFSLQKILDDLFVGELRQIGLSLNDRDSDCEQFDIYAIKAIVSHLNMALVELYTKFPLMEKEVIIQQYDQITLYHLNSAYAKSNTDSPMEPKYIIDTKDNPFKDDVLRIEKAFNEVGNPIPINQPNDLRSIFTPDYISVQIPNPVRENAIAIVYRAAHEELEYTGDILPSEIPVFVPPYLYQALLTYVAYRVNKSRSAPNSQQDAMTNLQLFESICHEIEQRNVTNNDNVYDTCLFERNGWV